MATNGLRLRPGTRSKLGGLTGVASVTALPKEKAPLRMPTFPNLERTAVMSLERTFTLPVGNGSTIGWTRAAVTRSPAYPLWVDRAGTGGFIAATDTFGVGGGGQSDIDDPPWVACTDAVPLATFGGHVYALYPSPAETPGTPLINVAATVNNSVRIWYVYGNGDGTWETGSQYLPDEPHLNVPVGHWFRITRIVQVNTLGSDIVQFVRVYMNVPTTRCLWPAGFPLELPNSTLPYDDTRCNASAALFTNVTRVMNKEGTVKGARLLFRERDHSYPWNFNLDDIQSVHPAERYWGALEAGSYTYTASSAESTEFTKCTLVMLGMTDIDTKSAARNVGCVDLDKVSVFNALIFEDTDLANGSQLAVTSNIHLEFRTTSSLFTSGYSTLTLELFHQAQLALLNTGYFFENDTHWTTVVSKILRGISVAAPIISPGYGSLVGGLAVAGDRLVSAFAPRSNMNQAKLLPARKSGGSGGGRSRRRRIRVKPAKQVRTKKRRTSSRRTRR